MSRLESPLPSGRTGGGWSLGVHPFILSALLDLGCVSQVGGVLEDDAAGHTTHTLVRTAVDGGPPSFRESDPYRHPYVVFYIERSYLSSPFTQP